MISYRVCDLVTKMDHIPEYRITSRSFVGYGHKLPVCKLDTEAGNRAIA